jgi:hypothetical protein
MRPLMMVLLTWDLTLNLTNVAMLLYISVVMVILSPSCSGCAPKNGSCKHVDGIIRICKPSPQYDTHTIRRFHTLGSKHKRPCSSLSNHS